MDSIIAAGLCFFFGAVFVYVGHWLRRRSYATASWIPVPAIIVESTVLSDDGSYVPCVRYKYVIDTLTYESRCVSLLQAGSSFPHVAQAVVRRYPPSSQVVAYVNPLDHAMAVLQPGRQLFAPMLFFGVGFVLVALGVSQLVASPH